MTAFKVKRKRNANANSEKKNQINALHVFGFWFLWSISWYSDIRDLEFPTENFTHFLSLHFMRDLCSSELFDSQVVLQAVIFHCVRGDKWDILVVRFGIVVYWVHNLSHFRSWSGHIYQRSLRKFRKYLHARAKQAFDDDKFLNIVDSEKIWREMSEILIMARLVSWKIIARMVSWKSSDEGLSFSFIKGQDGQIRKINER